MADPADEERGLGNRGTAYRIGTPRPRPPQAYPPFHVDTLGLLGAQAIPDALAYGLRWQLEFLLGSGAPGEGKELAEKLLALWQFLRDMEAQAPRAPDGALLVHDPLAMFARAKIETEPVELPTGETILATRKWEDAPLPVWAPRVFPDALTEADRRRYPARPTSVAEIPPFFPDNVKVWILTRDYRPSRVAPEKRIRPGRSGRHAAEETPASIPLIEGVDKPPGDEAAVEKALAAAIRTLDQRVLDAQRVADAGPTPTVSKAIAVLSSVTVGTIQRQTGVALRSAWADEPLLNQTDVILYHSVYSFVLDRAGNPFDLRYTPDGGGILDYAVLVPEPGSQMQRNVPPAGPVFVSVQKYGDGSFSIDQGAIKKVLSGGVGSFVEYGYGYSGPHVLQRRIQQFLDRNAPHAYIAGLTVKSAYHRREITLSLLAERLPEFVEAVIPYTLAEMIARAKKKLEHWEQFLMQIGEAIVMQLIRERIRHRVKEYLIKKLGKRIVPGVNAAFAVYDLVTGGTERMRMRHALACVMVALKSDSDEDMTIAAKTTAKIMGDEFEDAVIDALVKRGAKRVAKGLKNRSDPSRKQADAPEPSEPAHTSPDPSSKLKDPARSADLPANGTDAPGSADPSSYPPERAANAGDAPGKPPDGGKRDAPLKPMTARERAEVERWIEADKRHQAAVAAKKQKLAAEASPAADDPGTAATGAKAGDRGTGEKQSNNKETDAPQTDDRRTGASDTGTSDSPSPPAATGGRTQRYPPRRPRSPPDPNEPRGTLDQPRVMPPGPPPPERPIPVKEDDLPEGTDVARDRPNQRTSRATHERILRSNREKRRGLTPLDHDSHHIAMKRGGGKVGRRIRGLLRQAGVSIDDEANEMPARGLPRDPRAVHESDSQHWNLHNQRNQRALLRELESVRGDPKATRDVLRKHGQRMLEDRPIKDEDLPFGAADEDMSGDDDDDDNE